MTTYKPLVLIAGLDQQLDSEDSLDVSTIDTATLNLTGNLTVAGAISGDTLDITTPAYTEKTGWDLAYKDQVTLTFNESTRTFSIAPTGNSFHFWVQGTKYTKTTAQTATITDDEGIWFCYFDSSGDLQVSQTPWNIQDDDKALVSYLYWDVDDQELIGMGYELHSWTMDAGTHAALHNTIGSRYASGLALGDMVVDGGPDDELCAQASISAGVIYDEDIKHEITNNSPQQLAHPAQLPVLYRDGADGYWRSLDANGFLGQADTANGTNMYFNEYDTGNSTWQLTAVDDGDFTLSHIFATNDVNHPMIIIMGQDSYPTLGTSRDGAETEINELVLGDLRNAYKEFVPVATIIFRVHSVYDNDINAIVRSTEEGDDYIDWRGQYTSAGAVSSTTDHSLLNNLAADDHTQYILADGTRAFTGTVNGVTPTANEHLATKGYVDANDSDTTNHSELSNLSADDHTQYILADGTRAFTGNVNAVGQYIYCDSVELDTTNIDAPLTINNVITDFSGRSALCDIHSYFTSNSNDYVIGLGASAYIECDANVAHTRYVTPFNCKATATADCSGSVEALRGGSYEAGITSGSDVQANELTAVLVRVRLDNDATKTVNEAALVRGYYTGSGPTADKYGILMTGMEKNLVQGSFRIGYYTDSTRPSASSVGSGTIIYNHDDRSLNVSDGTNWRDMSGTIT